MTRHICTQEHPFDPFAARGKKRDVYWEHPQAREVEQLDGWPGPDYRRMECPICGWTWKEELPQ